jgi:hypothetical protein
VGHHLTWRCDGGLFVLPRSAEEMWIAKEHAECGESRDFLTCCGSQWQSARLATEHPSRPTIIGSGLCSRPT